MYLLTRGLGACRILNKLTVELFEPLTEQLTQVQITSENVLRGIIILLFDKALDEPKFCALYAQVWWLFSFFYFFLLFFFPFFFFPLDS